MKNHLFLIIPFILLAGNACQEKKTIDIEKEKESD